MPLLALDVQVFVRLLEIASVRVLACHHRSSGDERVKDIDKNILFLQSHLCDLLVAAHRVLADTNGRRAITASVKEKVLYFLRDAQAYPRIDKGVHDPVFCVIAHVINARLEHGHFDRLFDHLPAERVILPDDFAHLIAGFRAWLNVLTHQEICEL
ncbi:hypothetical protein D3C80_1391030 [compost metagenome]